MKKKILLFIISSLVLLWGCQSPQDYLSEALQIIQEHSIMRDSINWIENEKE